MKNFEIDTRRLNLLKRSNKLLEITRINYKNTKMKERLF